MVKRAAAKVAREIADILDGKPALTLGVSPDNCFLIPYPYLRRWMLELAPPQKRRAPTKSQIERKEHRASVKELDDLFRAVIRKRDGMRCRRCKGERHVQVAHVFSRRFHRLRWTTSNAMLLCAGCHLWQHHNPVEGGKFFEEQLGTRAYLGLAALKNARGKAPDHRLVKIHLEKELGT